MRRLFTLTGLLWAAVASAQSDSGVADGGYAGHVLSNTRFLRRVQFSVLGRPPTEGEIAKVKSAPTDDAARAALSAILDDDLASSDFYMQLISVGRDFLRMGPYTQGFVLNYFAGFQGGELRPCPTTSRHPGTLGVFAGFSDKHGGDPLSVCDDASATVNTVAPWWAPSTPVTVIGRAGTQLTRNGPYDCGVVDVSARSNTFIDSAANPCSCGPNLIYCWASPDGLNPVPQIAAGVDTVPHTPRRQAWEEGARLFAHLAWHDKPMTDLVAGNYTVAPLMLRYLYVRSARMNSANSAIDTVRWWDTSTWSSTTDPLHSPADPLGWAEFVPHTVSPSLLSLTAGDAVASGEAALARSYQFDPRVQTGEPQGVPFAGVLTSWSGVGVFPRERVRGARWLEVFACREFIPPTPEQATQLGSYKRDPATEGVCQHCHTALDPASIFFKRFGFGGQGTTALGGVGPWKMAAGRPNDNPYHRWKGSFLTDTVMTPVSDAQVMDNPDSLFLDFQRSDTPARFKLFGQDGDGTIGPLGFSKQLVGSGTFDRCFVEKMYEAFAGIDLDRNTDAALISDLVKSFTAGGRRLRPFVRDLMLRSEVRRGW